MTEYKKIDGKIAAQYAHYAMMSYNSYHRNRNRFKLSKISWNVIDISENIIDGPTFHGKFSDLSYDLFRNDTSGDVVMCFRGTDTRWDWLFTNFSIALSPHYLSAYKHFRSAKQRFGSRLKVVTGHSLGGGIALGCSVRYGIDAVVFDPSPRIFDGLCDKHLAASRIAIFQNGDPLQSTWSIWPKIFEVLEKNNIFEANYDFQGESPHRMDLLARGMLEMGSVHDKSLLKILEELPPLPWPYGEDPRS